MEMPLLPGSLRPLCRGLQKKKNAPKIWGKKLIFFFLEVYIYIFEDIEEKKNSFTFFIFGAPAAMNDNISISHQPR